MALIKCPECGKEISDKAASCPNCGFPIAQGSITQEPPQKPKEYDIEMLDSMRIKASKANIEVYYKGNLLLEANPMDFVLNYDKEEPDDLGRVQLKVAFSIPKYAKPFKICLSTGSSAYEQAKEFTTEIAERYFKKQYVVEWYMLDKSVMDNCDRGEANKTRTTIENIEKPKTYSAPEPQYTPQPTATKKKKKGGCANYFGFICLVFILIGWYSSKTEKKADTSKTQTEKTSSYERKAAPTVEEKKQNVDPITFDDELETFNSGEYAYITENDLYKYAVNMSGTKIYTVATISEIKDNKVQVTIGDKYMMSNFNVSDSKLYAKYESGLKDDDVVAILGTVSSVDSWGFMGDSINLENCMVFAKGDEAKNYKKDASDDSLSQYFVVTEEVANSKEVSEDEYKALCQTLDYNDILRNPDSYDKKYCVVSGTIDQSLEGIFGGYTLYIVDGNGNKWDCSYSYEDGETHYLEGDWVTVYGTCSGTLNSTTLLGKQVTLPSIDVEYIN